MLFIHNNNFISLSKNKNKNKNNYRVIYKNLNKIIRKFFTNFYNLRIKILRNYLNKK